MDSQLEDFCIRVLNWHHAHIERHTLQQLAHYLRNEIQPKLAELEALKAGLPAAAPADDQLAEQREVVAKVRGSKRAAVSA